MSVEPFYKKKYVKVLAAQLQVLLEKEAKTEYISK